MHPFQNGPWIMINQSQVFYVIWEEMIVDFENTKNNQDSCSCDTYWSINLMIRVSYVTVWMFRQSEFTCCIICTLGMTYMGYFRNGGPDMWHALWRRAKALWIWWHHFLTPVTVAWCRCGSRTEDPKSDEWNSWALLGPGGTPSSGARGGWGRWEAGWRIRTF